MNSNPNPPPLPAPTLSGAAGDAWLQDLEAIRARAGARQKKDTTLCSWLMRVPWAAPMTPCYWLCMYHLRAVPGVRTPVIHLPGATHEFTLWAWNPDFPLDAMACPVPHLLPCYFGAQFVAKDDFAARMRMRATVQDVLDGRLGPDTDWAQQWIARFGDNMFKAGTAATAGQTKLFMNRADGTREELVVDAKKSDSPCQCVHGKAPGQVCEPCATMQHDFATAFAYTQDWRKGQRTLPRSVFLQCFIAYRQAQQRNAN